MNQIPAQRRRAGRIDAADYCVLPHSFAVADGTFQRDQIRRASFRMCNGADDFRDNFPCLPHQNGIPDPEVLFRNKILIVQDSPADGCPGQLDRIKHRRWRTGAGTSHLNFNIAQDRFLFFRRIFESDSPPRKFGGRPQSFALGKIIHLNYGAVNVKGILSPHISNAPDLFHCLLNIGKFPV